MHYFKNFEISFLKNLKNKRETKTRGNILVS